LIRDFKKEEMERMKYLKGTRTEEIVFVPTLTQKPNRVLMGGFAKE
jgi:hypothetical protein